jgi:predicted HAD superfamily Cof-like phosphohydrolase
MSDFDSVGEFHRKFGLRVCGDGPPLIVDDDTFLFRYQFLHEELHELLQAHRDRDLSAVADALVDLVYVAHGTAHMYGLPFDEVFKEVQRANMTKERAVGSGDGRSKRGSALDVVKPEGWTPPDVEGVLARFSDRLRSGRRS